MIDTFPCPHCGADVPEDALACPACGSDEQTGWSEEAEYAHLMAPDDETAAESQPAWRRLLLIVLALGMTGTAVAALYRVSPLAALVGLLFLAVSGYFLYRGLAPGGGPARGEQLYADLLRKARGDEALVERWITYEASRRPDGDELVWMENARERWERDNR